MSVRRPFARAAPTTIVRRKTIARTRTPTLYLSAEALRRLVFVLRGDPRPDARARLNEHSGADQSFDDASCGLGRDL